MPKKGVHRELLFKTPADAAEGATRIRALLVNLFDRRDGTGADWPLMLESLYRAGFHIADNQLDDATRRSFMRRVYTGAYDRAAGNSDASKTSTENSPSAPSNTADLNPPTPRAPK